MLSVNSCASVRRRTSRAKNISQGSSGSSPDHQPAITAPVPTLTELNRLSPAEARDFFFSCCGSSRWAEGMAACRPFWDIRIVFNAADVIWQYLGAEDRREALRNRAAIELDGMSESLRDDLDLYRNRFGYEFVAASPPHSTGELQEAVRRRLEYPPAADFELSAAEALAIMRDEIRKRLRV
jgi:hypothetical protein